MSKKYIIGAVVVVIVLVIIVIVVSGNHASAPSNSVYPSQPTQPTVAPASTPVQTQTTASAYVSQDDAFSVNLPGNPQVSKISYTSPTAGSIPLTKYIVQSGSGASAKYYAIYVYHYPKSYKFSATYLGDSLRLFAASVANLYPGTKLVSQTPTEFGGGAAVSGVLSGPNQEPGYLLITIKNQSTYAIGTYGVNQTEYSAFLNSFTFTQ